MKLYTIFVTILTITNMLYTGYGGNMYTTCELNLSKDVNIVDKYKKSDLKYLKEDLIIPQLEDGNDKNKIDIINKKINDDIIPKALEGEKTAKNYYGELNAEAPEFKFEINSRYTVTTDNDSLISIYNDYYEFLGGAHGATTRTSYTVDKKLEELLELKDLFKEGYDYKTIINNEIKKQIAEDKDKFFETADKFKGIAENQNFYIKDKVLIIYYQQYDIAPYAAGIPEFNIPLEIFQHNYKYDM